MKILWSPLSLRKVREISAYIAQDKPSAAKEWVEAAFKKVKRLKLHPLSGRIVPEVSRPHIREIIFGDYRVIYRVSKKEVFILTVRHGKQLFSFK